MADRLSRVYGTEMDKVNCPFYFKMGACRYGDSCERIHNKPPISETVMLQHMYENTPIQTALTTGNPVSSEDAEKALTRFEQFYEDVFKQLSNLGQIQEMIVVDNLGDHIVGNVYIKFSSEEYAENAHKNINGRFFNGKKIDAHFSPVTDFSNAKCKQYLDGSCKRGGYCNYMHIKPLSRSFKKDLFAQMYLEHPEYRIKKSRSKSREKGRKDQRRQAPKNRERERSRDKYDRQRGSRYEKDRGDRKNNTYREKDRKQYRQKDRNRDRSGQRDRRRKQSDEVDRRDRKRKRSESDDGSASKNSEQRRAMIAKWNSDL